MDFVFLYLYLIYLKSLIVVDEANCILVDFFSMSGDFY